MRILVGMAMMGLLAVGAAWGELTPEQAKGKAALETSKITLEVKDTPLGEVLKELAKQSGNGEILISEALREKRVTVNVNDAPYWAAVTEVCRAAGTCIVGQQERVWGPTVEMAARTEGTLDPGAVTGPMMVKAEQTLRAIQKSVPMQPNQPRRDVNQAHFILIVFGEERLPIVGMEMEVSKVTTVVDGMNHPGIAPGVIRAGTGVLYGKTGPTLQIDIPVDDPDGTLQGAANLEGTLTVSYGLEPKVIKVEKLGLGKKGEAGSEERKIVMKSVSRGMPGMMYVELLLKGATEEPVWGNGDSRYGVFMRDADGKRYAAKVVGGVKPEGLGTDVLGRLSFGGIEQMEGDWTLEYVYPGKVAKRVYPFRIEGVPLP